MTDSAFDDDSTRGRGFRSPPPDPHPQDDSIRRMARARVKFRMSLVTYVIVNAMLVAIWLFADSGEREHTGWPWGFWPGWVMLFWGVGLAFQAWHAYGATPDALAREEEKLRAKYRR